MISLTKSSTAICSSPLLFMTSAIVVRSCRSVLGRYGNEKQSLGCSLGPLQYALRSSCHPLSSRRLRSSSFSLCGSDGGVRDANEPVATTSQAGIFCRGNRTALSRQTLEAATRGSKTDHNEQASKLLKAKHRTLWLITARTSASRSAAPLIKQMRDINRATARSKRIQKRCKLCALHAELG